jgi:hypothetical protein
VPQLREAEVQRLLGARDIRRLREVDRQDQRHAEVAELLDHAVLAAAAADPQAQGELAGEAECAQRLLLRARLDDERLLATQHRPEGGQRRIRLGSLHTLRVALVRGVGARVPVRIVKGLPDERDGAHGRGRVPRAGLVVAPHRHRLRDVRADHAVRHRAAAQADHRRLAAEHADARNDVRHGEALCTQRLRPRGVSRREVADRVQERAHLRVPVDRAALVGPLLLRQLRPHARRQRTHR